MIWLVIVIVIISFYLGVIIGWECANKAPKVKKTRGFWRDHGNQCISLSESSNFKE